MVVIAERSGKVLPKTKRYLQEPPGAHRGDSTAHKSPVYRSRRNPMFFSAYFKQSF
jgi:hypothetical protein